MSLMSPVLASGFFTTSATWEALPSRPYTLLKSWVLESDSWSGLLTPPITNWVTLDKSADPRPRRLLAIKQALNKYLLNVEVT